MSEMKDNVFWKSFSVMIGALAALTVVIYVLAQNVADNAEMAKTDSANDTELAQRIRPVGEVSIVSRVMNVVVPVAQAADGKATYDTACVACHSTGAAGAPKVGDKADWAARIAQGNAILYEHAIKGYQGKKGFMPAKGGNATLADDAVKAAVDLMVAGSK
jgi:cytochrome c5